MAGVGTRWDMVERIRNAVGSVEGAKFAPTDAALSDALDDALSDYAKARPRRRTVDVPSDGYTRRRLMSEIDAGWNEGTSALASIFHVVNVGLQSEDSWEMEVTEWAIRPDAFGASLLLLAAAEPPCQTLRLTIEEPHVVDAQDAAKTTVPDRDIRALTLLGAASLCEWMARASSDMVDASLGADRVDYSGVGSRWAKRAAETRARAYSLLAPAKEDGSAGGTSVCWNSYSTLTHRTRIGH